MKELFPFHHNSYPCGPYNLHYVDEAPYENAEGTIVLVHGNPTWSFYYRHIIKTLAPRMRVLALDHMGMGLSSRPQDFSYTLGQHIKNFQKWLRALKVGPFSLMVHDWGGPIGLGGVLLDSDLRHQLQKVIITNTAAFESHSIPLSINLCRAPFGIGETLVRRLNGFVYPSTFMAPEKKLDSKVKKLYLAPYDSYENRVAIYGFIRDIPLKPTHESFRLLKTIESSLAFLEKRQKDVLLLWGMKDFCFHEGFFNHWRDILPDAKFKTFAQAGHYLLEDEPSASSEEVKKFLLN
jgi:pimeloyl-ACP methyl ester carboxylesterase